MALLTIRQADWSVILSPTNRQVFAGLSAKRGTNRQLTVQVIDDSVTPPVPATLVSSAGSPLVSVTFGAKPANSSPAGYALDGSYAVDGQTTAAPDVTGTFTIPVLFDSTILNAALGYNPPTSTDDVMSVMLLSAVRFNYADGTFDESASFPTTVTHNVNDGTEGTAGSADPSYWTKAESNALFALLRQLRTVAVTTAAGTIDLSIPGIVILDVSAATGDVALTLANPLPGETYLVQVKQGAVPRAINFPAGTLQKGGGGASSPAGAAHTIDLIRLAYNGANYLINVESNYA